MVVGGKASLQSSLKLRKVLNRTSEALHPDIHFALCEQVEPVGVVKESFRQPGARNIGRFAVAVAAHDKGWDVHSGIEWGTTPPVSTGDKSPSLFCRAQGNIPRMSAVDREALRALVAKSGRSARAISLGAKLGATAVKDILSGKSRDPGLETMAKIAAQLSVSVDQLMGSDPGPRARQIVPRSLPIRGRVQAGLWYEVDNHPHFEIRDDERQLYEHQGAVVPNGRYSEWPQWLEIVTGESINRKAADGSLAHVVDAIEMGYAPTDKDWVVVERRRAQGALRERTIKQIEVNGHEIKLWPRSTDPRWQDPVDLCDGTNGDDIEVEIVGKVLGFYSPA